MNILIIGTGYVGLVTGACFAEVGHEVICLDIDKEKIRLLNQGIIPIFEPGLEEMVKRNVELKRLTFTTDYKKAVASSLFCFIAVSTPAGEDGSADLSYVKQAAGEIAKHMNEYKVIVNKSTVPVGSAKAVKDMIGNLLKEENKDVDFDVVSNPEFLKEGNAISDFMQPDRVVIGVDSIKVAQLMEEMYAPFKLSSNHLLFMDPPSAELTKYAANAMLASRISFMNEMSGLCERLGADINAVRKGIGTDPRIGPSFLCAGVGYGGSCFPKDIKALHYTAKEVGYETPLLDAIELVNKNQKQVIGKKIESYFLPLGGLEGKIIAIWGLAFKPGTDDLREASSLVLIRALLEKGAFVRLFDPIAMKKAKLIIKKSPQVLFCEDEYEACTGADAVVLMTEWEHFSNSNLYQVLSLMKGKAFFDGRNVFHPYQMTALGFDYYSIGQKSGLSSLESLV